MSLWNRLPVPSASYRRIYRKQNLRILVDSEKSVLPGNKLLENDNVSVLGNSLIVGCFYSCSCSNGASNTRECVLEDRCCEIHSLKEPVVRRSVLIPAWIKLRNETRYRHHADVGLRLIHTVIQGIDTLNECFVDHGECTLSLCHIITDLHAIFLPQEAYRGIQYTVFTAAIAAALMMVELAAADIIDYCISVLRNSKHPCQVDLGHYMAQDYGCHYLVGMENAAMGNGVGGGSIGYDSEIFHDFLLILL